MPTNAGVSERHRMGTRRPSAPTPGVSAKPRLARSNALREDYVQLIAELLTTEGEARPSNIARRLGVSHGSVIKAIARLNRDGLVVAPPYRGVFLTAVGRALAERVRLRHRRGRSASSSWGSDRSG
jgi:DtxR family transcriptional regulator, manganese transport regulator